MRSVNLKRFLSFALALVFFVGVVSIPAEGTPVEAKEADSYKEPTVRVGVFIGSSGRFSSCNTSASGAFEVGYASGGFNKIFEYGGKQLILIPQVNAAFNSGDKTCSQKNGNIGAYSAIISRHESYAEAKAVADTVQGGFVAIVKGGYEARGFSGNSVEAVKEASGDRTVALPVSGAITALDASGRIVFTYENTSRRLTLRATNGSTVKMPNGYSYMGYFEYFVSGGVLQMINCVGLESYTKCVMSIEIGTNYSVETRKAFSVMARTFVLRKKHGNDYNVCTTECCQVYLGTYRMSESNNEIVDATRGLYCAYNGSPILAVYHNSNGGASCSSAAAWGGDLPYLQSVTMAENGTTEVWKHEFSKKEFYEYLNSRSKFSSLEDSDIKMEIVATDPYGSNYITELAVSDGSGNKVTVKTSESVRVACGFKSANFDFEYSATMPVLTANGIAETVEVKGILTADGYVPFDGFDDSYTAIDGETVIEPDTITINGAGSGHGVGFSIYGSEQLAKDGYNYKYILESFFSGTTLEIVK